MDSYLTANEAQTLGASLTALPGVSDLLAESDATLLALLTAASLDLDNAFPLQGVKYDASGDQELAFPRYAHRLDYDDLRQPSERVQGAPGLPVVWDWDDDNDAAVVPERVKTACIMQAAHIRANPEHQARLDAIRSGLASQSIGSLAESYMRPADLPGGMTPLSDRASQLMARYRLRTGPML